jgi:hypothetical protein
MKSSTYLPYSIPSIDDKYSIQDIENLLKEANGNIEYLKTRLGITDKKYPKNLEDIYVLYFTPQQLKKASMPSGEEENANELWIPGGYTASENTFGLPELVITISKTEVKKIELSKYYANH